MTSVFYVRRICMVLIFVFIKQFSIYEHVRLRCTFDIDFF